MTNRILVFYGSYRSDRMGIRLAQFVVERLGRRGDQVELIDAKAINLPRACFSRHLSRTGQRFPAHRCRSHMG
jgi:NAD(P)H-dependent FMN reductase